MTYSYPADLDIHLDEGKGILHYFKFVEMLLKKQSPEEMKFHVALGLTGEAGEFADAVKRELIYCKGQNIVNITEELGDLLFYLVAALKVYDLDWNDIIEQNYQKLKTRYEGLKYSDKAAQDRTDKRVDGSTDYIKATQGPVA